MSGGREARLLGSWGEALAAEYLRRRGFQVLHSAFRCRFGEIDLIAENRTFLVFVEVKLRKSADFAAAREFVDARKQRRIILTAQAYLAAHPTRLQPRFDVIEIYAPQGVQTQAPRIEYYEAAFEGGS